jgi:two-component system, response regulator RegA
MSTETTTDDRPTVLLIDDDEIFAQTLGRALGRRGFDVTICTTVTDARQTISTTSPEMAVVDLRLPDGSGLCLLSELKKNSPETVVVVLTGYGSIASAVEAVKLGALNYLCKPVDADAVVAAFSSGIRADAARAAGANGGNGAREASEEPIEQPLTVMRLEWEYINRVLAENDGNISATARALNMHRRTLQRKLLKRPVAR